MLLNFRNPGPLANSLLISMFRNIDLWSGAIAMFLITSPIVIDVPTRGLLAVETIPAIVQWLENLNIKKI